MNRLTVEAQKIVDVVNKFRGASRQQLKVIIDNPNSDVDKAIDFLSINHYLDIIDGKYVTVRKHSAVDMAAMDCLWAVIDSMKYPDRFDYDTFCASQAYTGAGEKIKIAFIKDSKYIANVAYISRNTIMDVVFLQERFYTVNHVKPGEEKGKNIVHYFVTRNKDVAEEIQSMDIHIPYLVVWLDYKESDCPEIHYLKSKK